MKAYELHPHDGFDSLRVVDRARPETGPHDVRVRVRAVSLNYRDVVIAKGAAKRAKPVVPTSDGAGEVVEVGSKVMRFSVGDRVTANFFPTWTDGELSAAIHANALGGSIDGMLAEEVVLPETSWVKIPAHLSFEEAASLPCAGLTAWNGLYEAAALKAGDTILVQGTGGVSIFALQLARAAGAKVIATTSSEAKADRLRSLGASEVIDYKKNEKWGETAYKAAGSASGVDIAIEVGGAGTFDQSVSALRFGGTMSLIGILAGTGGPVNTHAIFHKAVKVHGIYVGSVSMFERFAHALDATKLKPIVDRTFAFDEARAAYEHLQSGAHFGKVVIKVG